MTITSNPSKRYGAEFLGTFALVLIGAGAVIVESHTGMSHLGKPDGKVGLTGIALAHGAILTAMIYAVGPISGGHFNPAVTLAAWLRQRLDGSLVLGYIGAQIAGSLAAAVCLAALFPDEIALSGLGTPSLAHGILASKGIAFEMIITFLLTTVILFVTRSGHEAGPFAGVAIGATLVALIYFAGPLTGAAANPARYLGPALIAGRLHEALVYLAGPFAGGGFAALLYGLLDRTERGSDPTPEKHDEPEAIWDTDPFEPGAPEGQRYAPRALSAIARGHELLLAGNGEGAAAVVLPLITHRESYAPDMVERARTFLRSIEEELGPLEVLAPHRSLLEEQGGGSKHRAAELAENDEAPVHVTAPVVQA